MSKISIGKVLLLPVVSVLLKSCALPTAGVGCGPSYTGGFPASTTETHTKTTVIQPPSYPTVNMPPPQIRQAPPIVQQPAMYPVQQPQCQQPMQNYQSSPCSPLQSNYDPCNYQVQVPQASPQRYTIAIPPAPAPSYTIALPQGNPPQYAVVQQQPPVQATVPVTIQSHAPVQAHKDICE